MLAYKKVGLHRLFLASFILITQCKTTTFSFLCPIPIQSFKPQDKPHASHHMYSITPILSFQMDCEIVDFHMACCITLLGVNPPLCLLGSLLNSFTPSCLLSDSCNLLHPCCSCSHPKSFPSS